jgi:hypothetical protein
VSARYLEKNFQLRFIIHDVFPNRGSGSTFLQLLLTDITNLTNGRRRPFRLPFSVAAFFVVRMLSFFFTLKKDAELFQR